MPVVVPVLVVPVLVVLVVVVVVLFETLSLLLKISKLWGLSSAASNTTPSTGEIKIKEILNRNSDTDLRGFLSSSLAALRLPDFSRIKSQDRKG